MTKKRKLVRTWADYNVETRFKPIDVDPELFTEVTQELPINKDDIGLLDLINIDTDKHPDRIDVQRRYRIKMKPHVSRFAFPTPAGYTTYRDYSTGKFYCDLYNLCLEHNMFEPKLLINHALMQPWWPSIYNNPEYKSNLVIDENYANLFHNLQRHLIAKAEVDDVKFYMHKNTTPGPPFTFFGGVAYDPNDILYGPEVDFQTLTMLALRKDYTNVKKTFLVNAKYIHEKQVYYSEDTTRLREEFQKAYFEGVLAVGVEGGRLNGSDAPINISPSDKASINNTYYVKPRHFTIFENGYVRFGTIKTNKLTDFLINESRAGWGGGLARPRGVANMCWASQISPAINTKMLTHKLEEGPNGFASNSDVCSHAYKAYLQECYVNKGSFIFLNGDRSNAESFVTTNYDQFGKLVLPELKNLYSFQNRAYMLGRNNYYFNGLASGMARTTELNWHAGTYEAIYTISKLLNVTISEVAQAYFQSIIKEDNFFRVGSFIIKLFMCTDDIPLVIYGDIDKLNLKFLESAEVKDRMMKWEINAEKMSTFGMTFTKHQLVPNEVSVIAKLFYSEHPGFFIKDCFSLYSKLQMLNSDLKFDVLNLLKKHYNVDEGFYADASKAFFGWLKEFGVNVSTVVDIYSPSGKIMYGNLVEKDAIHQSSRVSLAFIKDIFDYYKTVVKEADVSTNIS